MRESAWSRRTLQQSASKGRSTDVLKRRGVAVLKGTPFGVLNRDPLLFLKGQREVGALKGRGFKPRRKCRKTIRGFSR